MSANILDRHLFNIDIIAPKASDVKFLGEVSKLNIFEFSGSSEFEPAGLFSTSTFGPIGSSERNEGMGYMDIGVPILHPKIYQNFLALNSSFIDIIYGKKRVVIKNGEFVEDEKGSTGFYYFVKNYHKLNKLPDNDSDARVSMLEQNDKWGGMDSLSRHILILPAGLRDYTVKDGKPSEDEINNLYRSLLSASVTLKNSKIDINSEDVELYNSVIVSLQERFCAIYDYIKNILEGKNGFIQNHWTKHGVKYATRNVISPTTKLIKNLMDTNKIKPTDTIIGLHQLLAGIAPAAKREIVNFISNVLDPESNKAYLYNPKTMKPELKQITYKEVTSWTTYEGLEKIIKKFGQDDIKFLPIKLSDYYLGLVRDNGDSIELFFNEEVEDLTNVRPLTYIEFMYMAIYEIRNRFPAILTRFPVESMTSSYYTTLYLKVTNEDRDITFKYNGETKTLLNYPILESAPYNSLSPHYTRLDGLGADHDGDTCSLHIMLSDDSLEEANRLLNSAKYYLKPDGSLMNPPSIPPSDLLLKHLTNTFDGNGVVIDINELESNVYTKLLNLAKKDGVVMDMETLEEDIKNNVFLLHVDNDENVFGYIKFKYFNKYTTEKAYKNFSNIACTEYFILIEDIVGSIDSKEILLEKLLNNSYTGNDSFYKVDGKNEQVLELFGFTKLKENFVRYVK